MSSQGLNGQRRQRDKLVPDENRSTLGAGSGFGTDGSGMGSKKPRGEDTLCAHEDRNDLKRNAETYEVR